MIWTYLSGFLSLFSFCILSNFAAAASFLSHTSPTVHLLDPGNGDPRLTKRLHACRQASGVYKLFMFLSLFFLCFWTGQAQMFKWQLCTQHFSSITFSSGFMQTRHNSVGCCLIAMVLETLCARGCIQFKIMYIIWSLLLITRNTEGLVYDSARHDLIVKDRQRLRHPEDIFAFLANQTSQNIYPWNSAQVVDPTWQKRPFCKMEPGLVLGVHTWAHRHISTHAHTRVCTSKWEDKNVLVFRQPKD